MPTHQLQLEPSEIKSYQDEGFLYLGGLISTDEVEAVRREVLDVVQAQFGLTGDDLRHATGSADKLRQSSQYLRGTKLDELINGPATRAIAEQLLGGESHVYLPFSAVKAGGGGGQFHYHQDNNYTRHEPALGSINIWVALADMSPENGCLRVVPRSHQNGQIESHDSDDGDAHQQIDVDPLDALPVRMRAGDAIAFTRWTVHGSGPNTTDQPRVAYALQFHRTDVKFLDPQDNTHKLLTENQRFAVAPVDQLTPA